MHGSYQKWLGRPLACHVASSYRTLGYHPKYAEVGRYNIQTCCHAWQLSEMVGASIRLSSEMVVHYVIIKNGWVVH